MKNIQMLYKGRAKFVADLENAGISKEKECLVRIYTAVCTKEEAVDLAMEIHEELPLAQIVGASGSGVIFHGTQYEAETLVVLEQFWEAAVLVRPHIFAEKTAAALAAEIAGELPKETRLIHLLCGNHYPDIHEFIEEFNSRNQATHLVGGVVGDILSPPIEGYVFTEKGVVESGILTAAIVGDVSVFTEPNIAYSPMSTCFSIDKTRGSLLLEIQGIAGDAWCREQFGMEEFPEYSGWQIIAQNDALVHFPIMLEGHGGASRFLKYDGEEKEISLYFSSLPENTRFRIGYASPVACVQKSFQICSNILKTPVESLFCYSCLFRKLYIETCAKWELKPFWEQGISGVFMMGEICWLEGRNELLNGSCVFTGVADREVYVHPDLSVFDELNKVQGDSDKLLNFVVQKQSSAMSAENSTLMEELLRQQEKEQEQLYTDSNTKIYNGIKYSEDQNTRNFNKLCLGQIENAEPLMAAFGHEGYRALLRELAEKMHKEDDRINKAGRCAYYLLNDDIVFLAAEESMSQEEFMDIVNELYGRYHFVKSRNFDATLVFRFVVVLNRENLLGSALATLQKSKSGQSHFMVSDESTPDSPELGNELQMIQILNDVIEQESVIPYFQGIYDNKIKGINQYEALMRIADKNGKIYTPGSFMEIAKKYHLYLALSRLMLTKVFDLFGDRKERVSVNISACDIASDEMVAFLLEKLGALKTADNFVFEILEDENFGDMARLQSFIDKVRPFGVQVAIDDFGTGYSNFMEVIKIDPDYIKIDLGIVRSLDVDPLCRKVMETIIFLGERLHANLVAEGVETAEIQEKIAALAVEYSQGFHFAFPVPFGELELLES